MSIALERQLCKVNKRILRLETKLAPLIAKRKALKKELDKAVHSTLIRKSTSSDSSSTTSSSSSSEKPLGDKKIKADVISVKAMTEDPQELAKEEETEKTTANAVTPVINPEPSVTSTVMDCDDVQEHQVDGSPITKSTGVIVSVSKIKAGRPGVSYAGKCVKCARIAKGLTGNGVAHISGCSLYNPRGRSAA